MSLEGRVALVTGSGRGIGRAIAIALAEDGADVAVNYRKDEAAAKETVTEIEALGRRAAAYRAAVDNVEEDRAMVEAATSELGPIDILINNAGIASRGLPVAKTDPEELERVVRVHAFGPHYLSGFVLPGMKEKKRGDIIMISSAATQSMGAFGAPYNMGKAAMEALALTLFKEVRHHGIRVNIVAPGLVETEMGRRLVAATAGVKDLRELDAQSPFGHVCQPEDISNVVRFLVSDRGAYVTGERIYVHGGGSLA
jgi:NAD(P)-dependent dehydrogenase (short-subunit alcohol dehydrogenase family)